MTAKEAILKSLEELVISNSNEITDHIIKNNYCGFGGHTPQRSIASELGNFIRNGDSRVKRIKKEGKGYSYYLTKNEQNIKLEDEQPIPTTSAKIVEIKKNSTGYNERDLHKLLSSYLKSIGIRAKTILHEQSYTSKDVAQKWIHPDMVGVSFLSLKTKASQTFLKTINSAGTIKLYSYEIKKEINSDSDLKKYFFQAVSNSSWANYSYLVAFEISGDLYEEMERLNQSFGIGIVELKANPFESKVHFPSKYKEFDFKTIDKLCNVNSDFAKFIEQIEKLMTAETKYLKSTERELDEFCDSYFTGDNDIEKYCIEKAIPLEKKFEE